LPSTPALDLVASRPFSMIGGAGLCDNQCRAYVPVGKCSVDWKKRR
jgi:hypothetical protein